jgi:DNA-binding transcriptional regulator YiaG
MSAALDVHVPQALQSVTARENNPAAKKRRQGSPTNMKAADVREELLALTDRKEFKPKPRQVRQLRERAGLTKPESARVLKVGRRTWLGWENGERQMPQRDFELLLLLALSPEARAAFGKLDGLLL